MYGNAIYTDNDTKNEHHRITEKVHGKVRLTTPKIMRIKAQGFANYIGMNITQFEKEFGEPQAVMDSAINVRWLLYNVDSVNYLKVGIDEYTQKVCSIVVVGNIPSVKSKFKIGMSLKQLVKISTLYANFEVAYSEEKFQFELSENDLNNHPLIGFSNGSYVISYLQPNSKKVMALEFLNTDMLLKKNIYRIVSRTPIPAQYQGETNWEQLDTMVPFDLLQLINVKRRILANTVLSSDEILNQSASSIVSLLNKNPKRYLKVGDANLLSDVLSGDVGQKKFLNLDENGFSNKIYNDAKLNSKSFEIHVIFPFYSATTFFENRKLQQNVWDSMVASGTKKIGIAYDQGLLVIIINKGGN
ncbi:hypothetical protein FC80_GL000748 [Liquorilactobacillus cacaonum DSM 21116]|uniref:CAP-associated domain-containing protein n=2 Tax=Liquorilactobacillus cacaonum TaxID=483012 RepID=A0A0R2CLD9_9LACO|nr:hypothetical protein FC80_GL000748 [Liquorilactobacillus cacaonum DSM 21116]